MSSLYLISALKSQNMYLNLCVLLLINIWFWFELHILSTADFTVNVLSTGVVITVNVQCLSVLFCLLIFQCLPVLFCLLIFQCLSVLFCLLIFQCLSVLFCLLIFQCLSVSLCVQMFQCLSVLFYLLIFQCLSVLFCVLIFQCLSVLFCLLIFQYLPVLLAYWCCFVLLLPTTPFFRTYTLLYLLGFSINQTTSCKCNLLQH